MGINFASGIAMLFDAHQRYTRAGEECFLRVNNFAPSGDYIEVGVQYSPTGSEAAQSGFVDIPIDPPPGTVAVSTHDIGMSGGKLMFGARKFFVSDTFVSDMLDKYPTIRGRYNVWRAWDGNAYVQGIIYNNQLYSIEDIGRSTIAGKTIRWTLTCNASEEYLEPSVSEALQS